MMERQMKLYIEDVIHFPRELVFNTYRDELPQLAGHLPNIEYIEVVEREEKDNGEIRLLNLWKAASTEVPTLIRPFVKPELMKWNDHALWKPKSWTCEWRSEVGFFKEQVDARGLNTYIPQGDNAVKIIIEGEISVDAKKLPGVPRLMAGKIGSTVEKFVVKMIEPNLKGINRGLESYLRSKHG